MSVTPEKSPKRGKTEKSPKKSKLVPDIELGGGGMAPGEELLSSHLGTPKKEMSRAEKEKMFIVKKIEERLGYLLPEARYDQTKSICGVVAFLFVVAGGVTCLKALSLTVLFAADPYDPTLLAVGASMGAPCVVWFIYVFIWVSETECPERPECPVVRMPCISLLSH